MLKKIVKLCERHGFFRKIESTNVYRIESSGALLQENLRTEWLNNVLNKDIQVFHTVDDFAKTFQFAKEISLETFPFAVTRFATVEPNIQSDQLNFATYFERDVAYECHVFLPPSKATPFFHQWQRDRRIWWRKFSASPGRYNLSDIKNGDDSSQNVDIIAKYEWGDQLVESLRLSSSSQHITCDELQMKDGRKTVEAQCIVSKILASTLLLNTLSDAYDEPQFQNSPRPLLRLHRKLAPYKIAFSIPSGPAAMTNELKDLCVYLCRQLRKNQVSCLLLASNFKNTLATQWCQYDQMGIPYTICLNEQTLKNGIVQLRSRDTTLKEQVHVTDLAPYVEKLFKSY